MEVQLGATSDPARWASLQQQIAETDSSMRQVASQGKDALAVLYQQTGDAKYQTAFQALMAATSGNEIAAAWVMPGGSGGNAGRVAKEARPAVDPVEQAAVARARVESNARRDDNLTTGLVPAERVNKAFEAQDYSPPFMSGTFVNVDVAKPGVPAHMVIGERQAQGIAAGQPALGAFSMPDTPSSGAAVRRDYAITKVMKPPGVLLAQPVVTTGEGNGRH